MLCLSHICGKAIKILRSLDLFSKFWYCNTVMKEEEEEEECGYVRNFTISIYDNYLVGIVRVG